jgi:hypothetical protein
MPLTVAERGQTIATFRHIEVRLMEIAAAWVPTTPEMEVKVLLGKHIWDFAQHADALGKRTFELRLPEQFSQKPSSGYVRLLDEVAAIEETSRRLAALYDAILPGIERRYLRYVERTDTLLDAPSVVVVERILQDLARQRREADRLRGEIGLTPANAEDLRRQDGSLETVVVLRGEA